MGQPAQTHDRHVEADLHRVLTLARAHQKRCRVPGSRTRSAARSVLGTSTEKNLQRHRHALGRSQQSESKSLVESKMKAISAIYGLNCSADKLSDCTHARVKHYQNEMEAGKRYKADEVERLREQLLDSRRERYRQHYSNIKHAYGPSGKPKLEDLLQAAHQAKIKMTPFAAVAIGASVLTSSNRIYAAGASDNLQVCAERAVVLKMETSDPGEVITAMAISSGQLQTLPFPCGSCRELMATFGEFPVYLVNGDGMSEETTSFNLFPCATHCSYSSSKNPDKTSSSRTISTAKSISDQICQQPANKCTTKEQPNELRDWTSEHVLKWLDEDVGLGQYHDVFERNGIDGCTLLHIQESDIQLLLGIMYPLHRKRILVCIDRLRDRDLLEHGVDFGQLQDYLAVLDRDRIAVISELKDTFDRLDQNKDGFLDFQELKQALALLHCNSSAQAVEELMREGIGVLDGGGDGKVSFADFTKAFSSLAVQPAVEDKKLPLVDIGAMRQQFEHADRQKRGWLDEHQLISLVETIAKPKNGSADVRKWFPSVDFDRDPRVSFADFVVWCAGIKNIDIAALKRTFEGFEPLDSTLLKPFTVLPRSLITLFPDVHCVDIEAWCARSFDQTDENDACEAKVRKTISFADFALACLGFRQYIHERVMHTSELKTAMRNDALCHQTRIVHLQQTGHVRLCPQTPTQSTIGEQRRRHFQENAVVKEQANRKRICNDDDGKDCDSDECEDESKRKRQMEHEREIDLTFDRFIGRTKRSDDEYKLRDEDDEDVERSNAKVTAVQAAQAMTELGVTWPREQILQVIRSEGFDMRKCIDRRAFRRLFERMKSSTRARTKTNNCSNQNSIHERKMDEMAALMRGEYGKHRNRNDYDEYLRQRITGKQKNTPTSSHHVRRSWDPEMNRYESGRHKRQICTSQESKDDSSSSEDSSSKSKPHRRRHRSQGRVNNRRHRTRSSSSSSRDSDTCDSSTETEDDLNDRYTLKRRNRWRNFEVGDRIETRRDGHGTIVRLYPDYFVADVHFDSGKKLKNVTLSELKRIQQQRFKKPVLFRMGMTVLITHKGTKTTRQGKIVACRMDNTFDVLVRDLGHTETLKRVPMKALRPLGKPVVYMQGAKVTVKQRDEYLRGSIQCCHTSGSYDVKLRKNQKLLSNVPPELLSPDDDDDEEEEEEEEEEERTRKDRDSPRQERRRQDESDDDGKQSDEDSFEPEFEKDELVEARYQGKAAYFPGKIVKVFTNGTYDIIYDDGDEESRVASHLIRARKSSTKQQSTTKAAVKKNDDDYEEDLFESD